MGIQHSELRTEVLTLVNSNLAKYDANNNGIVDDGDELSQLLAEYQCNAQDLTQGKNKDKMWSLSEQLEIGKRVDKKTKGSDIAAGIFGGAGVIAGAGVAGHYYKKGVTKVTEPVTTKILKIVKEYVNDGKYRPNEEFVVNGLGHAADRHYVNHDVFTNRLPVPGDPQWVKTEKLVDKTENVTKIIKDKSIIKKGLTRGGMFALAGIVGFGLIKVITHAIAKKKAQTEIKAQQAEAGSKEMETRRQQAEEMRQREEALKQDELEYKERMDKATNGIQSNIGRANAKARQLNKALDEANEKVKEQTVTVE